MQVERTARRAAPGAPVRKGWNASRHSAVVIMTGLALLALAALAGLLVGAGGIGSREVFAVLAEPDASAASIVVWDMRVTRTLTAALAGFALGIAGSLMQAITRNPLADPGLLGVNAGAGLAVVVAVGVVGLGGFAGYVWFALLGAVVVSAMVSLVGSATARDSPATLVLAGTAITAALVGVATGLAVIDPARFNAMRGWMAGSVVGRTLPDIALAAVLIGVGLVLAFAIARPIDQLALGDDVARALGVQLTAVRGTGMAALTLLAGTATAVAGPIVFIGLMVPHLVRVLLRSRGVVSQLAAGIAGAVLLVGSDLIGRVVIAPAEAPAGLITAVLGAPVLALLARGRRAER